VARRLLFKESVAPVTWVGLVLISAGGTVIPFGQK
jgi:multidrug transporter EmrE-like cation transporter